MKSKTLIEKHVSKKNNPELVETIRLAKKKEKWIEIASLLSGPRRKRLNLNLNEIDKESKEGDTIVIPGKVLSQGELTKRIKIVAFSFSERAKEKLLSSKCGVSTIKDEIKKNPKAEGIRIVK